MVCDCMWFATTIKQTSLHLDPLFVDLLHTVKLVASLKF